MGGSKPPSWRNSYSNTYLSDRTEAVKHSQIDSLTCNLQAGREQRNGDATSPAFDIQRRTESPVHPPNTWQGRAGASSYCSNDSRPSTAKTRRRHVASRLQPLQHHVADKPLQQPSNLTNPSYESAKEQASQQLQHHWQEQEQQQATTPQVAGLVATHASWARGTQRALHATHQHTAESCTRSWSSTTSGLGVGLEQQQLQQQLRHHSSHPFSAYLQQLPSSARRPKSSECRPRSPLAGLSRLPGRETNNPAYNEVHRTAVSSTTRASNIYAQQYTSSRTKSRLSHHQLPQKQHHCTFKIKVNYDALPAGHPQHFQVAASASCSGSLPNKTQLAASPDGRSGNDTGVVDSADRLRPDSRSSLAASYKDPGLGMTLSEYMAHMHTTPIACNSVSGLGDDSDIEGLDDTTHHQASELQGSRVAWEVVDSQTARPESCNSHAQPTSGMCGTAQVSVTALGHGLEVPAAPNSFISDQEQEYQLDMYCSSTSSISVPDHATWIPSESQSLTEEDCYFDADSVSDLDHEQEGAKVDDLGVAVGGTNSDQLKVQDNTLESTQAVGLSVSEGLVRQPQLPIDCSTGLCMTHFAVQAAAVPTGGNMDTAISAPVVHSPMTDYLLRPGTTSVPSDNSSTLVHDDLQPASQLYRPSDLSKLACEQRGFTELDSSSEGFLKNASLGHLPATLLTSSATCASNGIRRSWQHHHRDACCSNESRAKHPNMSHSCDSEGLSCHAAASDSELPSTTVVDSTCSNETPAHKQHMQQEMLNSPANKPHAASACPTGRPQGLQQYEQQMQGSAADEQTGFLPSLHVKELF